MTYYRPVGTAELALLEQGEWCAFPPVPGYPFFVYSQFPGDPRLWPGQLEDIEYFEYFECLEYGQAEMVESWAAWGNDAEEFAVVWFEVAGDGWRSWGTAYDVETINEALVRPIEICARYGPDGEWIHPRLRSSI